MHKRSFGKNKPKTRSFSHSNRRSSSGFSRRRKGSFKVKDIDPARFINKAIFDKSIDVVKIEHDFKDFNIDSKLKQVVSSRGYKTPTPIQDKTIPFGIKGSDIVGIANTGTGKTAAFLLPLINKIISNPKEMVLIIAPTRELALQINEEFKLFTKGLGTNSVVCVGGLSIKNQIYNLKRIRHNTIIGTPGRIKDLIERRMIQLSGFNSIVLDEADRMLDMGFIRDTRSIMNGLPKKRQVFFFSATISSDIDNLIKEFLNNPIKVSVKTRDTSKNIEQDVVRIKNGENKLAVLNNLLKQKEFNKVLVFGRTKHGVKKLSKILSQNGIKSESIHGNKSNNQRQRALVSFKNNQAQVLVATDIAARGLDIDNISHVINYDVPATYTDYVHRIGRTGRGNKKGKALTFVEGK